LGGKGRGENKERLYSPIHEKKIERSEGRARKKEGGKNYIFFLLGERKGGGKVLLSDLKGKRKEAGRVAISPGKRGGGGRRRKGFNAFFFT